MTFHFGQVYVSKYDYKRNSDASYYYTIDVGHCSFLYIQTSSKMISLVLIFGM